MSKGSYEKLENALREHMADVYPGAILTDWILLSASAAAESASITRYYAEYSDSPHHTLLGLAHMQVSEIEEQGDANRIDLTGDDE